jgi:hypothetical protein
LRNIRWTRFALLKDAMVDSAAPIVIAAGGAHNHGTHAASSGTTWCTNTVVMGLQEHSAKTTMQTLPSKSSRANHRNRSSFSEFLFWG